MFVFCFQAFDVLEYFVIREKARAGVEDLEDENG